jgi:hypothetical protein
MHLVLRHLVWCCPIYLITKLFYKKLIVDYGIFFSPHANSLFYDQETIYGLNVYYESIILLKFIHNFKYDS